MQTSYSSASWNIFSTNKNKNTIYRYGTNLWLKDFNLNTKIYFMYWKIMAIYITKLLSLRKWKKGMYLKIKWKNLKTEMAI